MALPAQLDPTSPGGADQMSLGDDNIRAFKQFLIDFLGIPSATNCTAAAFGLTTGGVVTVSQDGLSLGNTTVRSAKTFTLAADPSSALHAATKQYVDGKVLPAGVLMLFQQTSAPTGWTKQTTHDNKALRVVSGTASSGGTRTFTSVFTDHGEDGYVVSHTLTVSEIPSHAHTYINPVPLGGGQSVAGGGTNGLNQNTGSTGGGGGHLHGLNIAVQYVDLIIASKN